MTAIVMPDEVAKQEIDDAVSFQTSDVKNEDFSDMNFGDEMEFTSTRSSPDPKRNEQAARVDV